MINFYTLAADLPGVDLVDKAISHTKTEIGLALIFILGALFILYLVNFFTVVIPEKKLARENSLKLTTAVEKLSSVVADTKMQAQSIELKAQNINNNVDALKAKVTTLLTVKKQELEAISVVAEKTGVDLSKQIDRASGALAMLATFENS